VGPRRARTQGVARLRQQPPFLSSHVALFEGDALTGVLLIAAGLPILLDSFTRFALQGLGTPVPIFPTRHLVVSGLYEYVRNPMYVAVVTLIVGQGLFFASLGVLEYGIAVWAGSYLFVLFYEEPTLRKSYGLEYEEFCANVPRWIPRLRPWKRNRE
jgi:protein-S-isoprenylcysteine O-methyltransferase Ste14